VEPNSKAGGITHIVVAQATATGSWVWAFPQRRPSSDAHGQWCSKAGPKGGRTGSDVLYIRLIGFIRLIELNGFQWDLTGFNGYIMISNGS